MGNITVTVRLRPVRFAFLVRPNDARGLLTIFRINTCLWGGKFNPIFPHMRQVPSWWDRHGRRFDSARQIINGFLDQYEPDFLVECEKGMADGLGFDPKRVLQPSQILMQAGDQSRLGNGLSVFDLYRELFTKEFQFERRQKHNIVLTSASDSTMTAFNACVFGDFPSTTNLGYFTQAFKNAFDPGDVVLGALSFADLVFGKGGTSPLDVGQAHIEVHYNDHSEETLFVMDASQPRDLIDFWNLRTLRRRVRPVPIQWLDELTSHCRAFIKNACRPLPDNPNDLMRHANVMFSRSIRSQDIEGLYDHHFKVDIPGASGRQDWYPTIWRRTPSAVVPSARPTLTAREQQFDVSYQDDQPSIRFDSLSPEFAARFGNDNRWVNVVNLRDWGFEDRVTVTVPTDYRNPTFSPFERGSDIPIPTTEGFVTHTKYWGLQHYWSLPDGADAIAAWLGTKGVEASMSDSGRATQQVVQTLGGFNGVRSIANQSIVNLLNEISRRPGTHSMQQQEFLNKIAAAVKDDIWRDRAADTLVKRNAVELGLELRCDKCSSWSWFSLKAIDYKITCSLCLREFSFPVIAPSDSRTIRWAYRLIGPFALPDFARGGYAAALAIRFFASVISHDGAAVAWAPGQNLKLSTGEKVEADFILWYQRTDLFRRSSHPTEIVFGEAKSFGRRSAAPSKDVFTQLDVDRLVLLAEQFPGAVLVFATMREDGQLTREEVARLRKVALWGRERVREFRRSRAPVIVLTGVELFSGYWLSMTWEEKGGRHKDLSSPGYVRLDNLKVLADLTQQLYLGLPSYSDWLVTKQEARKRRGIRS